MYIIMHSKNNEICTLYVKRLQVNIQQELQSIAFTDKKLLVFFFFPVKE